MSISERSEPIVGDGVLAAANLNKPLHYCSHGMNIDHVADSLNERRPSETLDWQSPAEAYAATIAMTESTVHDQAGVDSVARMRERGALLHMPHGSPKA